MQLFEPQTADGLRRSQVIVQTFPFGTAAAPSKSSVHLPVPVAVHAVFSVEQKGRHAPYAQV
jgi:hypothetical protein